jgi:hypothetical protein
MKTIGKSWVRCSSSSATELRSCCLSSEISDHVKERDVDFVTPPETPLRTVNALSPTQQESNIARSIKWKDLQKNMEQYMQECKDGRARYRQEIIDCKSLAFALHQKTNTFVFSGRIYFGRA